MSKYVSAALLACTLTSVGVCAVITMDTARTYNHLKDVHAQAEYYIQKWPECEHAFYTATQYDKDHLDQPEQDDNDIAAYIVTLHTNTLSHTACGYYQGMPEPVSDHTFGVKE